MDEETEARRAVLRRIVLKEGGNTALGRRLKLSTSRLSYLSQLITPGSKLPFGERSARRWEKELGLKGNPLLFPQASGSGNGPEPTIYDTVQSLVQILRNVPGNQREVTASLLAALAKTPDDQLAAVFIKLLESQSMDLPD